MITTHQLAYQCRIIGSTEQTLASDLNSLLSQLKAVAEHLIDENCDLSLIPEESFNFAIVLIVGYMWERPRAYAGSQFANIFANSGARALLSSYRKIGAVIIE